MNALSLYTIYLEAVYEKWNREIMARMDDSLQEDQDETLDDYDSNEMDKQLTGQ